MIEAIYAGECDPYKVIEVSVKDECKTKCNKVLSHV
jgi:hypothetical protein